MNTCKGKIHTVWRARVRENGARGRDTSYQIRERRLGLVKKLHSRFSRKRQIVARARFTTDLREKSQGFTKTFAAFF